MKLNTFWNQATQWLTNPSEQALEKAFRSAVKIKEIEDEHFQGHKISPGNSQYGTSVITYFTAEANRHLQQIERNLQGLRKGGRLSLFSSVANGGPAPETDVILQKLQFIDTVLARYERSPIEPVLSLETEAGPPLRTPRQIQKEDFQYRRQEEANQKLDSASRKTGVLPRSFLRTINRLRQEMNPQSGESERKVLNQYRKSRYKTALSVKFLLMLVIIPLLVHQLTKTFFLTPLVESYFEQHAEIVFINQNMEEEALAELQHYENSLRFQGLLGFRQPLSPEESNEKLKEKAAEIAENFRHVGSNAIANIFADLFSFIAFVIVLLTSQEEIEVLKEFIDEIVYGLSDSAKAFLIILFTDMFVGFHSPHGWEVILESIARHFGLPENRDFNFLFIATFPVILDTVFKYWIFRYLNSISPSSVATYRNMNE
ncbi:proton extrusion protein PcxA [Synechocystis sp. LKSZ1]|uniref:proton extrusion protein PcxA n=1 Tax=Synechocystis sp. LKSZ1 TaxID=3144951 RepID=UPI00336BB5DC